MAVAATHDTFDSLWRALGRPNLYLSYSAYKSIGYSWGYGDLSKYEAELETLVDKPWVEDVVEYRGARFLVTRER